MIDKIEIETNKKIPPGLMFSMISKRDLDNDDLYSMLPSAPRSFDVWTPIPGGHVPCYEAALFVRLLSTVYSSATGFPDQLLGGTQWRQCIDRPDSSYPLCMVGGDMLDKVSSILGAVSVMGLSGFFLEDLMYMAYVIDNGRSLSSIRHMVSVHSNRKAHVCLQSYLHGIQLRGVDIVGEKEFLGYVLYKLDKLLKACMPADTYSSPTFLASATRGAMSSSDAAKLDAEDDAADEPPLKFATQTFHRVPVLISDDPEDTIIGNMPAEFVSAVEPVLDQICGHNRLSGASFGYGASKAQAMVRLAQSLFMHLARVFVGPPLHSTVTYGVHVCGGNQRILPQSIECDLFHDILPREITQ